MMKLFLRYIVLLICLAVAYADEPKQTNAAPPASAPTPTDLKDLQELISLLRTHYADPSALTNAMFNDAAIGGILHQLGPGVQLLPKTDVNPLPDKGAVAIAKQHLYSPAIGYLRIQTLQEGASKAVADAIAKWADQKLTGLVLDLRFADGRNFGEAAEIAGLFIPKDKPLFRLQGANPTDVQTFVNSREPLYAAIPLIVLVNHSTRGAPEALAGVLQQDKRGLIIGNPTAGEAFVQTDIPFHEKTVLRLATSKVVLASGTELWRKSLEPEIMVKVEPDEGKEFVLGTAPKKESKPVYATGNIRSEAELLSVYQPNGESPPPKPSPELGEQTDDPVLQRALDVISALRAFRPTLNTPAAKP